ncbi:hypothetical protein SprV_0401552500 [Sparganum proliferum]
MTRKTEEVQGYADRNETKSFFTAIKAIYGPPSKGTKSFLSPDEPMLLPEKSQILKRCTEHFRSVFNRPSTISDAAIDRLPQLEFNIDLNLPPSQKPSTPFSHSSAGKQPAAMQPQLKSTNTAATDWWTNSRHHFRRCDVVDKFLRISSMKPSSTSTSGQETSNPVTITEASLCLTSLGRSSSASSSVVSTATLSKDFCQKVSVD